MWLSYSAYNQYKNCPQRYNFQRVKKLKPTTEDSKHNAIVGTVVQKVFEEFYTQEIWRKKEATLDTLLEFTHTYFWEYIATNYIDFKSRSCSYTDANEVLQDCLAIIPNVLSAIKRDKLIGPYAKSEVKLEVRLRGNDFLFGYIDFIIRQSDDTILLLDGKASKHREKYIDETQLHFYALLFYFRYKKLPDKLGFFYYRFADDPEKSFDWIETDKSRIKTLRDDVLDVMDDIGAWKFKANPVASYCQFCPYEDVCTERINQKSANSMKRKANAKDPDPELNIDKDTKFLGF